MYLTYEEYVEFGGTLDETIFTDLYYEAKAYIDYATCDRLQNDTTFPDEVKRCVYSLIRQLNVQRMITIPENYESSFIESLSNDGVSKKYSVLTGEQLYNTSKSEVRSLIKRYLSGVKNSSGKLLLYRGIYKDE